MRENITRVETRQIVTKDPILILNHMRKVLKVLLRPETLDKLVELQENLGDEAGMLNRYEYFLNKSEEGEDCRYTKMAKHYFVEESGENVINLIKWLYDNWAGKV